MLVAKRVKEVINLNRIFNYLGDDVYDETLSEIILAEFSRNTVTTEKLICSREKVSHFEIRFATRVCRRRFPDSLHIACKISNWKNCNRR